jgi:hypothetical protein
MYNTVQYKYNAPSLWMNLLDSKTSKCERPRRIENTRMFIALQETKVESLKKVIFAKKSSGKICPIIL